MKTILSRIFSCPSASTPRPKHKPASVTEALDQYHRGTEAQCDKMDQMMQQIGKEAKLRQIALSSKR